MLSFLKKKLLKKTKVAIDEFGNCYYKQGNDRWVVYNNMQDPSVLPPLHYLWLNHSIDQIDQYEKYDWERKKTPNFTGSENAYLPSNHILKNPYANVKLNYIPWSPENE